MFERSLNFILRFKGVVSTVFFALENAPRCGKLSVLAFPQIYADDVTNQMIFSLNVYCDHYQLGCKWKGHLKKLEVCSEE